MCLDHVFPFFPYLQLLAGTMSNSYFLLSKSYSLFCVSVLIFVSFDFIFTVSFSVSVSFLIPLSLQFLFFITYLSPLGKLLSSGCFKICGCRMVPSLNLSVFYGSQLNPCPSRLCKRGPGFRIRSGNKKLVSACFDICYYFVKD